MILLIAGGTPLAGLIGRGMTLATQRKLRTFGLGGLW